MPRYPLSGALSFLVLISSASGWAQVDVLTQHNDNARTGANLNETVLDTSNVRPGRFGKLFSRAVDGQVQAQPLYVSNLPFPDGVTHNVIYVATENNSIYAYDADDSDQSSPLWRVNLGPANVTPNEDFGCTAEQCPYGPYHDLVPQLGITGTPVIDRTARTLYVVAFTKESGVYHQRLYGLDLTSGRATLGPVEISGAVSGTGDGSVDGVLTFDPMQHFQRPALLLSQGVLYLAFASHADYNPYHGWVFAYDAATLDQLGIFCTTPNGGAGGIWQSNQGPAADASGNIYFMTGNSRLGTPDPVPQSVGESFVKLRLERNSGLTLVDYFIPCNQCCLDRTDADLGSAGPLLIPGTDLLVGAGKQGRAYVLNQNNLGGYQKGQTPTCATGECNGCLDEQIVQRFQATSGSTNSSPIFWDGPDGPTVYFWGNGDRVKAYKIVDGRFQTTPSSMSTVVGQWGGDGLSLSANGSKSGTGIIWATRPLASSNPITRMGEFYAFDASNLAAEGGNGLWSSNLNETFDGVGIQSKYNVPTVANGKVYVASSSGQVHVYGLLPKNPPPLVRITAPTTLSTIVGPTDITLTATALSRDGSSGIVVQFYADDTLVGTADSEPYRIAWRNATLGHHKLRAVATDPNGATAKSEVAEIDVVTQAPQIGSVINLKFVGPFNPMDPNESAGVVARLDWNNVKSEDPGNRTREGWFNTLVDDLGMPTGASVSWTASGTGFLFIPDVPGDFRMIRTYLETTNTTSTNITVYNLPESFTRTGYDVYVYFDGDNGSQSITSTYRIGSTVVSGTDAANVDFAGKFIEATGGSAGNYVVIPGLREDRFTLEAMLPAPGASSRITTPVNAIQVVARTVQP